MNDRVDFGLILYDLENLIGDIHFDVPVEDRDRYNRLVSEFWLLGLERGFFRPTSILLEEDIRGYVSDAHKKALADACKHASERAERSRIDREAWNAEMLRRGYHVVSPVSRALNEHEQLREEVRRNGT